MTILKVCSYYKNVKEPEFKRVTGFFQISFNKWPNFWFMVIKIDKWQPISVIQMLISPWIIKNLKFRPAFSNNNSFYFLTCSVLKTINKIWKLFWFLKFSGYLCAVQKIRYMDTELEQMIVKRASELFLMHGIKSITMDFIAGDVGISKRTLYEVFRDKDALLLKTLAYQEEKSKE